MVFPMGKTNPELMWNNLLKKENLYKLDKNTKHPVMGTHSLRRFFEDNIGHGKLSKYMLNKLTRSQEPYMFKTKHKLEDIYNKYVDNLLIFDTPERTKHEVESLKEKMNDKDKEIERLKESVGIIDKGRHSFEDKFKDIDNKFKRIEDNLPKIFNNPLTPIDKVIDNIVDFARESGEYTEEEIKKFEENQKELVVEKFKKMFRSDDSKVIRETFTKLLEMVPNKKNLETSGKRAD